jgi:hypothetical protein
MVSFFPPVLVYLNPLKEEEQKKSREGVGGEKRLGGSYPVKRWSLSLDLRPIQNFMRHSPVVLTCGFCFCLGIGNV